MPRQVCWLGLLWAVSIFLDYGMTGHISQLTNWIKQANITELACEGKRIFLSCNEGEGIKIKSAFWGRDDPYLCSSGNTPEITNSTNQLCKPLNPSYPLVKLKQICDASPTCEVDASEAYFEIPLCKNITKYLRLVYDCRAMSGLGARR